MGSALYNSKNVRTTSSGWSGFQQLTTGNVTPYVDATGNFLQLYVKINRENSNEYISRMEVSYELFTNNGIAYNITPYILVKADSPFTGNTASEVNNEARAVITADPVNVTTSGTGDINFVLDFNSYPLDFINKPQYGIYLLIATSSTSANVATCTYSGAHGLISGPGIEVDFAGDLGTYTARFYPDSDTEAIYEYNIDVGVDLQVPDGITKQDEAVALYWLYPKANGGRFPTKVDDGSYEVTNSYSFINWYCQEDGQTYNPGEIYTKQIDSHFIAQWRTTSTTDITDPSSDSDPIKDETVNTYYNIYYNLNYSEHTYNVSLKYTDTVSYSFKGWYTTSSGNTRIQDATFTKNSNVYAQYNESHERSRVQLPNPSRTGFTLLGYSNSPSSSTIIVSPGGYYDPIDNNGITFYAVWKSTQQSVSIRFNTHYGTLEPSDYENPKNYLVGYSYFSLPGCIRSGYNFEGWYTAASGGTLVKDTDIVLASITELHAHWTQETKTIIVSFSSQGSIEYTRTYTVPGTYSNIVDPSTRTGYNFTGWYTTATSSSGVKIQNGDTISNSNDHTLYARWSAKTITVTYDTQGGSAVSPPSRNIQYNSNYILPSPDPTKSGYVFSGWFTSATGGNQVTSSTRVTNDNNHKIYAHWTQSDRYSYILNFNINGGSGSVPSSMTSDNQTSNTHTFNFTAPTNITKEGYTWIGWSTNASSTVADAGGTSLNRYTINGLVNKTVEVTLYAIYEYSEEDGYVRIYYNNQWRKAIPYVRTSSGWRKAIPYVYNKEWKMCN